MIKSKSVSKHKVIPLADVAGEYLSLKKKIDSAVTRVLSRGHYILGDETRQLEEDLAAICGVKHGIGVNSGTDALLLALRALDIGPGDEVILPAMTFIATAEVVVQLGARPVFVDIHPQTYTLNPKQVEAKLSGDTRAIIAVHLYGQPVDMDPLLSLAKKRDLPIIEDMAQAIGATYHGRPIGSLGRMACLSFYPTKNLGACGDGGMVLTSDEALAFRLRRLRNHGARVKYDHEEPGYNSRLDEIQSSILRVKLPFLDKWTRKRIDIARDYTRLLADCPAVLPHVAPNTKHVYHQYSICSSKRDALHAHLQERGIQSAMHYPKPLHLQTAFKPLGGKPGDFPHSERLAQETLSLPMYPLLPKEDVLRVAATIQQFFKTHGE